MPSLRSPYVSHLDLNALLSMPRYTSSNCTLGRGLRCHSTLCWHLRTRCSSGSHSDVRRYLGSMPLNFTAALLAGAIWVVLMGFGRATTLRLARSGRISPRRAGLVMAVLVAGFPWLLVVTGAVRSDPLFAAALSLIAALGDLSGVLEDSRSRTRRAVAPGRIHRRASCVLEGEDVCCSSRQWRLILVRFTICA
jgi:hypothetical protein